MSQLCPVEGVQKNEQISAITTVQSSELPLPAGYLDKFRSAYDFGADAIDAGATRYSLGTCHCESKLALISIGDANSRGKWFFITSNLLPHNDKVRT
jgi:putative protease